MVRTIIRVQRILPFDSKRVYDVLKDYRTCHPYILPDQYFEDVKIIQGYGIGEGTRIQKVYKIPKSILHYLSFFLFGTGSSSTTKKQNKATMTTNTPTQRDQERDHNESHTNNVSSSYTRYAMILDVTEPDVGRIIQEIDTNAYNIIQFIVDPIIIPPATGTTASASTIAGSLILPEDSSSCCTVTIDVRMFHSIGIFSMVDVMMKKYLCQQIYTAVLDELYHYMIMNQYQVPDMEA